MTDDTISRHALYETLCRIWDKADSEEFDKEVFATIKDFPSAQTEIIRCKDCTKWKTIDCPFFSKYITVMPNEEQYCSLAERRTDERMDV